VQVRWTRKNPALSPRVIDPRLTNSPLFEKHQKAAAGGAAYSVFDPAFAKPCTAWHIRCLKMNDAPSTGRSHHVNSRHCDLDRPAAQRVLAGSEIVDVTAG